MSERPRKAERTAMATGLASGVGTIASVAGILQILESGSLNLLLKSAVFFAVLFPVAWGIALIRKKIKKQRLHLGHWEKASVVATTVLAGALVGLFVVAIWPGNSENPCGSLAANDGDEGAAHVSFLRPAPGSFIDNGQDVDVGGTVSGLGDNSLWLVTKPDAGAGYCFLTSNVPIEPDGDRWAFSDVAVGDESDRGKNIVYLAVVADEGCARVLATTDTMLRTLPSGCSTVAELSVQVRS